MLRGDRSHESAGTLLSRVRAYLRDLDQNPEFVRRAIEELGEEELNHFGLRSFFMNLLAVFGDVWRREYVHEVAVRATRGKLWHGWEYYSYVSHLQVDGEPRPRLEGVDGEEIRARLEENRGLVVCTCHLGDYRHISTDLALVSIASLMPLDAESFAQYQRTREVELDERFRRFVRAVNVEEPKGSMALARTLSRNGLLFAYVDGNTGQDGPLGESSRTEVEFLGYKVRVKNGLLRLAGRFGRPVLPVMAPRVDGAGILIKGPLLDPGGPLKGAEQQSFVDGAAATLYRFFEGEIRRWPEQWETACFFHRWRAGAETQANVLPDATAREEVERDLAAGKVLRMNGRRIVPMGKGDEAIWTDVKTLRAFRAPAGVGWLLDELSSAGGGVDLQHLSKNTEEAAEKALAFLSFLRAREAVTAVAVRSAACR